MATFLDVRREDVVNNPLQAARRAAAALPAVVAMKGAETYVVAENGQAWLSRNGSIGLATSGSGDTLAGILAGLVAGGTEACLATVWAVYMHGQAGRNLTMTHGRLGSSRAKYLARYRQLCTDLVIDIDPRMKSRIAENFEEQGERAGVSRNSPPTREKRRLGEPTR